MDDVALEQDRPPPVGTEGAWVPTPKQELFLRCPTREALYGGAAGAGKTDALLIDAAALKDHPHHRALLLRRTKEDFESYLLPRSFEIYEDLGGTFFRKGNKWVFTSGATVQLGAADKEASIRRYAGAPYNWIGWDELTHFTEWQYTFMFSRNRSAQGLPCFMRSGSNPGGVGHDWVLKRWAAWMYFERPDFAHEYPGPYARPGRTLYYVQLKDGTEKAVPAGTPRAMGRTFIPGRVKDNPFLAGTDYELALAQLALLDRLQLEEGDWLARPAKGMLFRREWWKRAPMLPAIVACRLRYWDLASTPAEKATSSTAWTSGIRMSAVEIGKGIGGIKLVAVYLEDIVRGQWSPGVVEKMIEDTATDDLLLDPGTVAFIERDPGQAGIHQAWWYRSSFASRGRELIAIPPQGDKIRRARLPSGQAQAGNIYLVEQPGRWIGAFLAETDAAPEGLMDQVDSLSGGFFQLMRLAGGTGLAQGKGTENIGDALPKPLVARPGAPAAPHAPPRQPPRIPPRGKGGW